MIGYFSHLAEFSGIWQNLAELDGIWQNSAGGALKHCYKTKCP